MSDIYTISDITVIDGQAKEFVNGIMTTTAMNGPTFDQLYAEIDELRKRVVALEGMIRNETYTYMDGNIEECIVWGRKIGSGSGDVYNEKFTNDVATFIPEVRHSVEDVKKDGNEIEKFGAAIMEIGNVIDFHVPNTGCNNGCINCGHSGHTNDKPIEDHQKCPCYGDSAKTDYCARIYVDRNNSLIIRANGLYYQPIHNVTTNSLPVTVFENSACVKAEMAAKTRSDGKKSYYEVVNGNNS
jgi:hypothetical protein